MGLVRGGGGLQVSRYCLALPDKRKKRSGHARPFQIPVRFNWQYTLIKQSRFMDDIF